MAAAVKTERQIIADVKKGNIAPVYLITGDENYYIDVLSDFFENEVIPEENQCFDQLVVYGVDVTMSQIVDNAKQYPVLPTSTHRLILVKEAQNIKIDTWTPLVKYLSNPLPTTILVFCYRHKKIDKRTAVYKAINDKGVVFERGKMQDYKLPEWIASFVQSKGYDISPQTSMILAETLGNDLGKIVNEMSKLFLVLPQGAVLTPEIVEKNIGISKDYNVFELQNAIGRKDVLRCNRIINHFADNPKETPIQMVIPSLYSYFLKIMIYHQLQDKSQAASAMEVPPYFVRDYQQAARCYSLQKLAVIITYLKEADLKSKGIGNAGTVTDGEILKELVFKILH